MKLAFGSVINALVDENFGAHYSVLRKDLACFGKRIGALSQLKATGIVFYHLLMVLYGLLASVEVRS